MYVRRQRRNVKVVLYINGQRVRYAQVERLIAPAADDRYTSIALDCRSKQQFLIHAC